MDLCCYVNIYVVLSTYMLLCEQIWCAIHESVDGIILLCQHICCVVDIYVVPRTYMSLCEHIWSSIHGHVIYKAVMSEKRFKLIKR